MVIETLATTIPFPTMNTNKHIFYRDSLVEEDD